MILPKAAANCGSDLACTLNPSTAPRCHVGHRGPGRWASRCALPSLPCCPGAQKGGSPGSCRVAGHGTLQQFHAADAVDQRVVHLDEERKAVALQPLDDGAFPGRARQVNGGALQAANQLAQLALTARPGQRGVAHVVLQVDVGVLYPGTGTGFLLKAYFSRRFQGAQIAVGGSRPSGGAKSRVVHRQAGGTAAARPHGWAWRAIR
jgi:hypothetical protein